MEESSSELGSSCPAFIQSKRFIGVAVVVIGSIYPIILKWTKQGEQKYPFMIGVGIVTKNTIMLCYYLIQYMRFRYNKTLQTYHILSPVLDNENIIDSDIGSNTGEFSDTTIDKTNVGRAHGIFSTTPTRAVLTVGIIDDMKPLNLNDENINSVENNNNNSDSTLGSEHLDEINESNNSSDSNNNNSENDEINETKSLNNNKSAKPSKLPFNKRSIWGKLYLCLYLAPNAFLVLINDILALYTLQFVTVATYAIFMQISLLFIVIVRYYFLSKTLYKSQLLSVIISMMGMILFKLVSNNNNINYDTIGIILCTLRGIIKSLDLVYVEWFIHHLHELEFYEKQAIVSIWFVICSIIYLFIHHFNDIFLHNRPLFSGFALSTWIFVFYGAFFAILIYLLILQLDSLIMGFCQQLTVLFAVGLDVLIFHTNITPSMWICAFVVVIAISQYSLIQYEMNKNELYFNLSNSNIKIKNKNKNKKKVKYKIYKNNIKETNKNEIELKTLLSKDNDD